MAAALQNEMKDSMTVVATTTLVTADRFRLDVDVPILYPAYARTKTIYLSMPALSQKLLKSLNRSDKSPVTLGRVWHAICGPVPAAATSDLD